MEKPMGLGGLTCRHGNQAARGMAIVATSIVAFAILYSVVPNSRVTFGPQLDASVFQRITNGMTETEVIRIVGFHPGNYAVFTKSYVYTMASPTDRLSSYRAKLVWETDGGTLVICLDPDERSVIHAIWGDPIAPDTVRDRMTRYIRQLNRDRSR